MMRKAEPRKRYQLLLSDEERDRYQREADKARRDLADWIRVTLDAACPVRRRRTTP